ncbi:MAG: geranylgeranylglycerol-phosphate geranylgeranyltransferase [Nitrososphaerota archaeon]|jgi:geranylgeranylglycerol-phosphate geranylgeranyltransferase|nr:geranylgeranylglycerol-phosphate geranylgeranyltransferase [Nitrososphaerota archaeon]MDG6942288.1 geranylgeranylglycerol-phosphate geranylgeranyltransferase [Nitrososphaerota archaeon]MDG6942753.1 geranylgeranylglycerol-phosphate geranylgeranyltransferase [Nitrososphaerota archaeon]MDG6948540.1 geranylgeranylglycerol-phosphate geranylgeranyltransferase [Nitrososphaerota archaeon]MDG6950466.1 geranylgeranylglycerol-phosphate geranylgeranyltransferase [Nitrososphaerota archaeon]
MDLGGAFKLVRPVNCAMIGFAVIVGAFVSRPPSVPALQLTLGFLTGFFICAYSMIVNDIYDVDVDRVNRPERPIPSGRVSAREAKQLAGAALVVGMVCSALSLNPLALALAAAYTFLSWLYNSRAKKTGLPGNMIVASSLAIPFIYGGATIGGAKIGSFLLLMALTAFFSGVGREVVKAMADVEGDAKRNISSVARSRGLAFASQVGALFFLLAVVTSWVPLIIGLANSLYAYGVAVPDATFVYLAAAIVYRHEPSNALRVKNVALAGMTAGLLVFIGGAL